MEKTMKARVQHKHDIEANWLKATNFTPLVSEIIVYDPDENYDYPRIKIGDGETNINSLPFITEDYAKIADIPTKPADIGAQPAGNYLTSIPSEYVTESELNAKGYLTDYTERDPTVPAWAKAATKPTYTASEVGALPSTTKIPSTLSELGEDSTHRVVTDAEKAAWSAKSNFSGSYNDLSDKPTIPSTAGLASVGYVDNAVRDKVDKDGTKVLSTNDYTTAEKNKLAGIAAGAEVNVNADWNAASGDAQILNKPTLGTMAAKNSVAKTDLVSEVQSSLGKADTALQPGDISDWAKQPNKPSYTASDVGALPSSTKIPAKTSDLTNDSGFITGYTETDPTVPSWAKAATKPTYTASEVNADPSGTAASAVNAHNHSDAAHADIRTAISQLSENKADKSGLTLGMHTDGLVYLFVNGQPVGAGIEMGSGDDIVGYVDADNNIILSGVLADGTYTVKYEDADGKVTEIGTLKQSSVTYTNLFDPNTASLNTRMSGSSKAPKNENGYVMTASIPITATQVTSSAVSAFIAVPKSMWSGSANMFLGMGEYTTQGMCGLDATIDVVVGDFVKIPLRNQWGNSFTCDSIILSLYVKGSAIAASDIQNIEIYFNEIPE